MPENGMFERMCREAEDTLAGGEHGWKSVDTNTLFLACFGMLYRSIARKISRPLWFFASSVASGVIFYVVKEVFLG